MRNTRKALTTGVTWLTRDGVLSQPTSHIGALTLLSADCVLAWRQLGLKHDVNFTKCRYRSEHTKTKCRIQQRMTSCSPVLHSCTISALPRASDMSTCCVTRNFLLDLFWKKRCRQNGATTGQPAFLTLGTEPAQFRHCGTCGCRSSCCFVNSPRSPGQQHIPAASTTT